MMKQWSNNRERICYEKTSNFNEKKKNCLKISVSKVDVKKLQSKYNNIKTNWRKISIRQKNGDGLSQGLCNIRFCP